MSVKEREAFRALLTNVLERRLFFLPSFKIYGGVAGFYDFGPPGCAIKQNVQQFWRKHFVLEEAMLEVECPAVTTEPVLQASGHVERFTDFMVTDIKTGECHRADHLLENALETAKSEGNADAAALLPFVGELDREGLAKALEKFGVKAPETKNDVSPPFPFNLMFKTSIGPKGDSVGYLRPETAQGIFVNFRDLLYFNGNKLPFAAAQIGQSYRNEISPRAGLIRVREFTQAEIEHFLSPEDKSHPKFNSIAEIAPLLFSRELQKTTGIAEAIPIKEAVGKGTIANQTLAYFIARTYLFMKNIGIQCKKMRFRQHLEHEMAHYAEDCWDCEVETSYGWIECVGLADRSAYDLRAHSKKSGVDLVALEKFPEPRDVTVIEPKFNKREIGKTFKADSKIICDAISTTCEPDLLKMKEALEAGEKVKIKENGKEFEVDASMLEIVQETRKLTGRNITPNVIEPSFGIGRIVYSLFEHSFYVREGDEQRSVFRFNPLVAPVKTTVFSLLQKAELNQVAEALSKALTAVRVSNLIDTGGTTIGKRYARTDELGIPFAVTVDFQVFEDETVTLRERDSTKQVRIPKNQIPEIVRKLTDGEITWEAVLIQFPCV